MRRRCEARLRSLDLAVPFDIREFCDALARRRGRPIRLCPADTTTGPCGLWIATDQVDYFVYDERTSPVHQEHIILHEFSHAVCEHSPEQVLDEELAQLLFPDLSPVLVRHILGRTCYSEPEEREAEMTASLIAARVHHWAPEATWTAAPGAAEVVDRVGHSLERLPTDHP